MSETAALQPAARARAHHGLLRRALRREAARLRQPRHIAAILVLAAAGGIGIAALWARGELAGADARAYWAAVRIWLNGGDPYHPTGPFMPYVYAPWLLPAFVPWAVLPWETAWFTWRAANLLLLGWSIGWAYRCVLAPNGAAKFRVVAGAAKAVDEQGREGSGTTKQSAAGPQNLRIVTDPACAWAITVVGVAG